jgi:K+-transporting ATPase ATPase C chain
MNVKRWLKETKVVSTPVTVSRETRGRSLVTLLNETRVSIRATLALAVLLCGVYPIVVWGVAQGVFPRQARGSLIVHNGRVVGSNLIGQAFKGDRYFQPRPSAAGNDGYDATASGGSNLGPLSQKLIDQVRERTDAYRSANNLPPDREVPADAVTASGSGLDPHISIGNAELQAARVAGARGMAEDLVKTYVRQYTESPQLGFLGEPRVNVLKLNLALDAEQGESDAGRQVIFAALVGPISVSA